MDQPESNRDWARRRLEEYRRARLGRMLGMRQPHCDLEPLRNVSERMYAIAGMLEEHRRQTEEADKIRAHALGVRW